MTASAFHAGFGTLLAHLHQRTVPTRSGCLRMSTFSRPHNAPLFVVPSLSAPLARTRASAVLLSLSRRKTENGPCATCHRSYSPQQVLLPVRPFSHSTHGPRVLLVFPEKSLKIVLSGRTVVQTNSKLYKATFSRNARRPRLAFPRASRRLRLFCKPSRKSFCSSSWRSL